MFDLYGTPLLRLTGLPGESNKFYFYLVSHQEAEKLLQIRLPAKRVDDAVVQSIRSSV